MKFLKTLFIFSCINFGALAIGSWLMGDGSQSEWYLNLEKAPWTPEGWVFGAAWFTVMLCFSIYMTYLYLNRPSEKVVILFMIQFLINSTWNYLFFNQKLVDISLLNIVILTIIVFGFLISYQKQLKLKSLFVLPYATWLCIATSLNLYIYIYN